MNNKIRWTALALSLVAGMVSAQSPLPPHMRRQIQPVAAKPLYVQPASLKKQYQDDGIAPMSAPPVNATPVGCSSCGGGNAGCASGGCSSGPGFVGGCCDYMRPKARGVWNGYCDQGPGCFFGCNSPLLGGCCNKIPIGLYGATPLGCCAAGVGPRHGWECGAGCGSYGLGRSGCASYGMGCGGGCFAGASRSCGWRMGAGGYSCAPAWSAPTCGCDGGNAMTNATPTPAPVTDQSDAPAIPAGIKSARTPTPVKSVGYPLYPGVR